MYRTAVGCTAAAKPEAPPAPPLVSRDGTWYASRDILSAFDLCFLFVWDGLLRGNEIGLRLQRR